SIIPTKAHSKRRSPSECAAGRLACDPRWARSVIASTMPCARAFSPRSNASCSTAAVSTLKPRRAWRCSSSSRAGTTPIAATPLSTICRQSTTKGATTRAVNRKPSAVHSTGVTPILYKVVALELVHESEGPSWIVCSALEFKVVLHYQEYSTYTETADYPPIQRS